VSRLIGVDDGFVRQRRFEFRIRRRDGRAGLFPRVLGTAQTDRNLQCAFEKALHDQPWHAAHDRQIRNQGRQLRPELGRVFVRQRGQGDRAAVRTLAAMAAVLGDVRRDRRQLRHLMPAGPSDSMARVQAARAVATRLRREIHDCVHPLRGCQFAMASRMARLPAGFPSALRATTPLPLLAREAIRRRRFRGDGGILLLERELALEIGDTLRGLLEQLAQSLILLAQPLDVLLLAVRPVTRRLVVSRSFRAPSRHRRERTKSLQKVQVQNRANCQRP